MRETHLVTLGYMQSTWISTPIHPPARRSAKGTLTCETAIKQHSSVAQLAKTMLIRTRPPHKKGGSRNQLPNSPHRPFSPHGRPHNVKQKGKFSSHNRGLQIIYSNSPSTHQTRYKPMNPLWRNWLARQTVNLEAGSSTLPGGGYLLFWTLILTFGLT